LLPTQSAAQTLVNETLVGVWRGSMTTTFQGQTYKPTLISIEFGNAGNAKFGMSKIEEGTYVIDNNDIRLVLKGETAGPILLTDVQLNQKTLTAKITLPSDPSDLTATINLKQQDKNARLDVAPRTNRCAAFGVPDDVKAVLQKYELECPIDVHKEATWYEHNIVAKAFTEILSNNRLLSNDADFTRLEVFYNSGFFTFVFGEEEKAAAERLIKPLLKDPTQFSVRDCSNCLLKTPRVGELKPEFVTNDTINYELLWQKILSTAETIGDARVDLTTLKQQGDLKSVETKFRRLALQDGFIVGEKTKLQIDPLASSGALVQIVVESQLLMRGISERTWVKISIFSLAGSGRRGTDSREVLKGYDIEHPYMRAILATIMR